MDSITERQLKIEITKLKLENKQLRSKLETRIGYETRMCEKVIRLFENMNIPFETWVTIWKNI